MFLVLLEHLEVPAAVRVQQENTVQIGRRLLVPHVLWQNMEIQFRATNRIYCIVSNALLIPTRLLQAQP